MRETEESPLGGEAPARSPHSARGHFALVGAALAGVVPAAALLARVFIGKVPWRIEIREHAFFYLFALGATALLIGLFGAVVGSRIDALRGRRDWYRDKSRHDDLTGFLTPTAFRHELARVIEEARDARSPVAVLLASVDGVPGSETEHGSGRTKAILFHLAAAIRRVAPSDAIVSRWGGFEVAILLPNATLRLDDLPQRLCDRIAERPVVDARRRFFCRARVGGYYGVPTLPPERILMQAQDALAQAHRKGERILISAE
jgi:GGDEF domain-containing protein